MNNLIKSLSSLSAPSNQSGTTDQNFLKEIIELKQNQMELQENVRIINKNLDNANKKIENSIKKIDENETKLVENCNLTGKHSDQIDELSQNLKKMINNLSEKASQDYANKLEKNITEINLTLEKIMKLPKEGKVQDTGGDSGMRKDIEILKEKQKGFEDSLASILK